MAPHHGARTREGRAAFDCTRLAGLEVEYERCDYFTPIAMWARAWGSEVHEDGSCGWEAVTAPASGDALVRQTRELFSALGRASAETSITCGIHVHVDARDLRWTDVRRLCEVYGKVEALLYLLAGQHRAAPSASGKDTRHNYSKPCGSSLGDASQAEDWKGAILAAIYSRASAKIARDWLNYKATGCRPVKKDRGRYVGMNLCPWIAGRYDHAKDTTIEFRMHRDSLDGARVLGWAKLVTRLVEWCAKASDAEACALPNNAARALAIIAPDCAAWVLARIRAWRRAVPRTKRRVIYYPTATGGYYLHPSRPGDDVVREEELTDRVDPRGLSCAA